MFDTSVLISWVILWSIGMWYFMYWKKTEKYSAFLSGLVLIIFPYFVTNIYYLVWIGLFFIIIPFLLDF